VTYWRWEQLLWEKLELTGPRLLKQLKLWTALTAAGAGIAVAALLTRLYVPLPATLLRAALAMAIVRLRGGDRGLLHAALDGAPRSCGRWLDGATGRVAPLDDRAGWQRCLPPFARSRAAPFPASQG
jgi:hypothetical protein